MTRSSRRLLARLTGLAAAAVFAATLGIAVSTSAAAADYPSWSDLQNAKSNTASAAKAVQNVQSLIASLQSRVAEAQALSQQKTDEYLIAQQKFDDADRIANELQTQADAKATEAASASKSAGMVAAQLYRTGGSNLTLNLFLESDPAEADQLLSKLGTMNQVVGRASEVYQRASVAAQSAKALTSQAKAARTERESLRVAAEQALQAAVDAQIATEAALAEQESRQIELQAQLEFLQDSEAKTAAAYQAGVEERRRLAEEAAQNNGGSLPAGFVNENGWARPAAGRLTDVYGPRAPICSRGGCSGSFHYGIDLGTGCSSPIYAANAGRVVFAGYSGTWGNYIKIDHGGGIYTAYAHIAYGGTYVGYGQFVDPGQHIASSGTTGASTGCHLHFEVYSGSSRIDPLSFMADRGIGF